MKIYETLTRDPRTERLANSGQARIDELSDDKALTELRAELETFVCDARFGDGLQRILDRYLANLTAPRQDAAWVSGFFGSGKSHLLKMLSHLWTNTAFPDGATARGLVPDGLPRDIEAAFKELDVQARRTGKPAIAAAGTLLSGSLDHVRLSVLAILLRACGLPSQYPQARFCFWLREQGLLDAVRASVEAEGRSFLAELHHLYVSPVIARSLLRAMPDFAADEKAAHQLLIQQFPRPSGDIDNEQFLDAARKALSSDKKLPLAIVVLDEAQQYLIEDAERSATFTDVAEAIQTGFDSRVMLVASGQSALSAGTHALAKLRDRFRISVELTDADVELVTRRVLLKKRETGVNAVESVLEKSAGEIARHLQGSRIGHRQEDRASQVADYPLLLTRRRFWEVCLQAVDAAGAHSQLRSQLWILNDSLKEIADREVGAVIPAGALFSAIAPNLVNAGILLNEVNTTIQKLDDSTDAGRRRRDLCGLVFLIGKLPREAGVDTGVRATASVVADLMVEDLARDSGPLRKQIADELEALASQGVLQKVGEEYRIQTTEGAEWERDFRARVSSLKGDEVEVARQRDQLFAQALDGIVADTRLFQGQAKVKRSLVLHTGPEAPASSGAQITVWLRDGWSCAQKDVERQARKMGSNDPTVHVFLAKQAADELRKQIVDAEAAKRVVEQHPTPSSHAAAEAKAGMESRRAVALAARGEIVRDVLRTARVFQGGGGEVYGESLADKVRTAAERSLARLYPRFAEADGRAWEAAIRRARDGDEAPFKVAGWDRPTEEHPVSKEVLATIGAGAKGSSVEKTLEAPPCGWPRDAIDAAIIALHRSGHLRALRNGELVPPDALDQASVKSVELKPEKLRLTSRERIDLRGLFQSAGVTTRSGEEEVRAPAFLDAMEVLAASAGGDAPLPPCPDLSRLQDLRRLSGTEQLAGILERRDELQRCHAAWTALAARAVKRLPSWKTAVALARHAEGLQVGEEAGPELDAIRDRRSLLDEDDRVSGIAGKLAGSLRQELSTLHRAFADAVREAADALDRDATWARVDPARRADIGRRLGLEPPTPLSLASSDDVLRSLDARSLAAWRDAIDAVPRKVAKAIEEAAAAAPASGASGVEVTTTTVAVRRGTLEDERAVRAWLAEHEAKLLDAARKGPVIVS